MSVLGTAPIQQQSIKGLPLRSLVAEWIHFTWDNITQQLRVLIYLYYEYDSTVTEWGQYPMYVLFWLSLCFFRFHSGHCWFRAFETIFASAEIVGLSALVEKDLGLLVKGWRISGLRGFRA